MIGRQFYVSIDMSVPNVVMIGRQFYVSIDMFVPNVVMIGRQFYVSIDMSAKIVQNKMPHSLGWNRDFRYRRNSGATMWMRGESPAGLFNALTMTVL